MYLVLDILVIYENGGQKMGTSSTSLASNRINALFGKKSFV